MTNWQTKDQVQAAAKGPLLDALVCSMEHHKQGAECEYEEAVRRMSDGESITGGEGCALCVKYGTAEGSNTKCSLCPLQRCTTSGKGATVWSSLFDAFQAFVADRSRANFDAFQAAERKMVAKLDELIAEEKGKMEATLKRKKINTSDKK